MNWFKIAQIAQIRPTEYTQIGHRDPQQDDFNDCDEYLWIWQNGRLDYQEDETGGELHEMIWGEDSLLSSYSGRFDNCTNRISLGIPDSLKFRDVPNSLINQLLKTFSPDAEIWTFRSTDPGSPRGSGAERIANKRNALQINGTTKTPQRKLACSSCM